MSCAQTQRSGLARGSRPPSTKLFPGRPLTISSDSRQSAIKTTFWRLPIRRCTASPAAPPPTSARRGLSRALLFHWPLLV
eukprot:2853162-Prymnesium_polylepis.1